MQLPTMVRVVLMAALTAVAAQIAIRLPSSPFTLPVVAVILSGLLLGARYGALAKLVYLLLEAAGVPVFARFSGGAAHLVGLIGGYLNSYPVAAATRGPPREPPRWS